MHSDNSDPTPLTFWWLFFRKVWVNFRGNQGFLLAGALAYYTLLSIIPIFALILVLLSQFWDMEWLLTTVREYLVLVVPGQTPDLIEQMRTFLTHREVFWGLGLISLVFFASFAFSTLEKAMGTIFKHRHESKTRHFMVSVLIPICYMITLGLGLVLVGIVSSTVSSIGTEGMVLFGRQFSFSGLQTLLIFLLGLLGEILILTSFYMVMPVGKTALPHALIGGTVTAVLWEIARHIMIWYFANLSPVNVIYGSFATAIIVLLSLEVAAVILLLGAQFIAEYECLGLRKPDSEG